MRTKGTLLSVSIAASALGMAATLGLNACSTEPANVVESGTVSLPLQVSVDGTLYALSGTLTLEGPGTLLTETVDETDGRTTLQFEPRVGNHTLTLEPGWALYREEPAGSGSWVLETGAELTSDNPQSLSITKGSVVNAELAFNVPGRGPIVFARGTVNVSTSVEEGYPPGHACTASEECASHVCTSGICAVASCTDGVLNGTETSPDCGPDCAPCTGSDGGATDAGASDATTPEPTPSPFDVTLAWAFTPGRGDPWPDNMFVGATPVVVDVDENGIPDVAFGAGPAAAGSGQHMSGVLRVVNGADGSPVFTVGTPAIDAFAGLAAGDIDGDGHVEIVAVNDTGTQLVAFSHTGTLEWESTDVLDAVRWGAPAIANVTGSALPEVVLGRQVFDGATGALLWTGNGSGRGMNSGIGPASVVADLDRDGSAEVIAGNTVYDSDGAPFFAAADSDGFPAVADFDGDTVPEVALVGGGMLRVVEGLTGALVWYVLLPGNARGGPPLVADFDGDGRPDVGVAAGTSYIAVNADGAVLWQFPIEDFGSQSIGASAFDFDGDGDADVVIRDERSLHFVEGETGMQLFETVRSPQGALTEYPLVADLDGDDHAELLVPLNSYSGGPLGLEVYTPSVGVWPRARGVWNQHAYHVTNVNDDGSIPAVEPPSWLPGGPNSYREQR